MSLLRILVAFLGTCSAHRQLETHGASRGNASDDAIDFWVLEDAKLLGSEGTNFSVTAMRLVSVAETKLTAAGEKLTVEGFTEFFASSGCLVTTATFEHEKLQLTVTRPADHNPCIQSSIPGVIVVGDADQFALSIEISEYITDGMWEVFKGFLEPALAKLETGWSGIDTTYSDMLGTVDDMAWLWQSCQTLGCAGSLLSETLAVSLMEALADLDRDKVEKRLASEIASNGLLQTDEWGGPGGSDDQCQANPQQVKLQMHAASAGARVGIASLFHIGERIQVENHRAEAQQMMKKGWNPLMSIFRGGDRQTLPNFNARLNFQACKLGLGYQTGWAASYGFLFPLIRDKYHTWAHPDREEYTVDSSIFASLTANAIVQPLQVMADRRNAGMDKNSPLLRRHVYRGLMMSGSGAFLWGASYGAVRAVMTQALGPDRAKHSMLAIDALGAAAGIAAASPFNYVAYQRYVNPNEQISAKEIFKALFKKALASDKPLRSLIQDIGMKERLKWSVPRFALTQLAIRAVLEMQAETQEEKE